MLFRKAQRQQAKLRIGISAPSGFGKTKSSLLLAYGLCEDWSKIAVIDTENNSADLYSHLGPYNVVSLDEPFEPEAFIRAIELCEAEGMEVIIIDCISAEWSGTGGCLEIKDKMGGAYQDWKYVTPRHNALMSKIRRSTAHMITTTRRKADYVVQLNEKGKHAPKKLGLKEDQRENYEYELDVNFVIEDELHQCTASKDRTELYDNKVPFVITSDTGRDLRKWADTGLPVLQIALEEIKAATALKPLLAKYPQLVEDSEFQAACKLRAAQLTQKKAEEAIAEAQEAAAVAQLHTPVAAAPVEQPAPVVEPSPATEAVQPAPVVEAVPVEAPAVEQPAPAKEKPTAAQLEELTRLLNHPDITRRHKVNTLIAAPKMDAEQYAKAIAKAQGLIDKAANKSTPLSAEEVERLDKEQHEAVLALIDYVVDHDTVLPSAVLNPYRDLYDSNTDDLVPTAKLKAALAELKQIVANLPGKSEAVDEEPASQPQEAPATSAPNSTPALSQALTDLASTPKVTPVWNKYSELQENQTWKDACANRRKELFAEREVAANELLQFVRENEEALGQAEVRRLREMCHDTKFLTADLVLNREQGMEWLMDEMAAAGNYMEHAQTA